MTDVVIGVGTNLEDRLTHLRRGVRALRQLAPELVVTATSSIYESDALVPDDAPASWRLPYLNLAVRARWRGQPESLVAALKAIEAKLGRVVRERWAPREVDLDLLTFGDIATASPALTVPHAGLASRPFALLPLADVGPEWVFPAGDLAGRTAASVAGPWRASHEHVPLGTRRTALSLTEIVGTLNLTPDSFSDGGRFTDPTVAVAHAGSMIAAGATILDIGAESTRPGATPLDPDEEWRRLEPVLRAVLDQFGSGADKPLVSVDTRRPATAVKALRFGVDWINDVTGFGNEDMVAAVAPASADLVAMHSVTVPPERGRVIPVDRDPMEVILEWGGRTLERLERAGVAAGRVVLDPGIGFGKTPAQNTSLLASASRLQALGCRWLVGHSRKSFLASWFAPDHPAATQPVARDFESALIAGHLASAGVDYVRVHDVELAARAIRVAALLAPVR